MKNQEEFQKKYAEYAISKSQLEGLAQELNAINATIAELQVAKATLDSIKDLKGSPEILVPIGGNTFLQANIKETEHVLAGIGAGVIAKKDTADTVDSINTQLDTLTEGSKKLEEQAKTLGEMMSKLEPELQEMMAKAQHAKAHEHPHKHAKKE